MSLVLKVVSINNQTPKTPLEVKFDKVGGTIGRKLTNTWVLPDEQRHLSGSHASIESEDEEYYIVDTSTNGVFVNGSDKPLGKGNKQLLENGFQLLMGTFNIEAIIEGHDANVTDLPVDKLIIDSKDESKDGTDDLFSDLFDDSDKIIDDNLFEPLDPVLKTPQKNIGSDDPFFDFGEFNTGSNSQIPNQEIRLDNDQSEMDSFFKPSDVDRFSLNKDSDKKEENINVAVIKEDSFFDTDSNDLAGIPDDWNLESETDNLVDDFFTEPDELSNKKGNERTQHSAESQKNISISNIQKDIFVPAEEKNLDFSTSGNAFLKGLGVNDKTFNNGLSEEQLFLAGKLFKSAIKGTVDVLQSRAEIKNEMRMDMTTIQPIQNNPIKFAVDIDEAIKKLLSQDNKSYMDPEQAMNEVYDDITSHQLAIISGIQASLSHVLKRFEPKNLIARFEENSPISASIPVHRKAKLWEAFESLYDSIEAEAEDDFNRLFGQEFAKAYDEQVEMLKKKRTK